ncbi:NADH dehydrogenase [Roseovarius albus]|uniref:NADH dehydrogenase n=1 Tax=Roseovarius albus TaxID=1247867 RepID=A0A1X7A3T5_9RHOB|nr:NAD(P)/FAD-dependent oxidoreductase [Roseovarius albus]SLN69859.1 NADH dehydrogenase [Roseovarius albus]
MAEIVIIGGGAGGLELAIRLSKKLRRSSKDRVTLVDRKMNHVWKPLFHEVAAGTRGISGDQLSYLSLADMHGFRFRTGEVLHIDREAKTIAISGRLGSTGESIPKRTLPYDHLVFAIGSEPKTFGIPGITENCFFLDTLEQASRYQDAFFEHCLRLDTKKVEKSEQLRISIIGGGATGVELAAELTHSIGHLTRYGFDAFDASKSVSITLIEAAPRILPQLDETLSTKALERLQELGVDVRTSCKVHEVLPSGDVKTEDDTVITSDITAWVAGIGAPSVLKELVPDFYLESGFLAIQDTLQLQGDETMWALGDCARLLDPKSGRPLPPKAQVASQQAEHLANELSRLLVTKAPAGVFRFKDHGSLVNFGSHSTIGMMMGNLLGSHNVDGWFARRAYKLLYRRHQFILHGALRGSLLILSEWLRERVHPRLKLH